MYATKSAVCNVRGISKRFVCAKTKAVPARKHFVNAGSSWEHLYVYVAINSSNLLDCFSPQSKEAVFLLSN